jgi:xylono-1,5-lactonase
MEGGIRTMHASDPICIWDVGAQLGEGVVWVDSENAVYFVDVKARRLHRYTPDTGERQSWPAPGQIGFALPCADKSLVCGVQDGLYLFDSVRETFSLIKPIEQDRPGNRLNDGYVDKFGGLWFGSMDDAEARQSGVLYHIARNGQVETCDRGYVVTNGPVTNPNGTTLFHSDTLSRIVYAFDIVDESVLTNKRVFIRTEGSGYPDGMAVDIEGCLWIALYGGGRIERYSPKGRLLGQVTFPCSNVTNLTFGGSDLRTVYATTARKNLSEAELQTQFLAGGLFSFRAGVQGQPQIDCTLNLC